MLLVLLVMAFSLTFFLLEPPARAGRRTSSTRTDALYFTLSTMATVGYGDVHAEGQAGPRAGMRASSPSTSWWWRRWCARYTMRNSRDGR